MEAVQVQEMYIQIEAAQDLTTNHHVNLNNRHHPLQDQPLLPHNRPPQKPGEMKDSQAPRTEEGAPVADGHPQIQINKIKLMQTYLFLPKKLQRHPLRKVGEMKGSLDRMGEGAQVVADAGTKNLKLTNRRILHNNNNPSSNNNLEDMMLISLAQVAVANLFLDNMNHGYLRTVAHNHRLNAQHRIRND